MTKKRLPAKLRRSVRKRAKGYCEYCVCPEFCATQLHSIEHIEPESKGGAIDEDNLALACQVCGLPNSFPIMLSRESASWRL